MAKVFDSMLTSTSFPDGSKNYFIKPDDIFDFFSKVDNIQIPDYQRPYSWEEIHIKALLDDIKILEDNKSWFLGPIFIAKPAEGNSLQLLDGQQRATSLQLLLRELYLFEYYFEEGYVLDREENLEYNYYKSHKGDIYNCLLKNDGGLKLPRFNTEITARVFFKDFINSIVLINSNTSYERVILQFNEDARKLQKEGSRTAFTLLERNSDIRSYLKENFLNLENPEDIFKELNKFISNVLYKLWIIQIPLLKTAYSTNIFESINNRGKGLTLIDKLKFKTLTKFDSDSDDVDIDKINNQWKVIYKLIDESVKGKDSSEKGRFFKKEDDFFSVFFNSIDGEDTPQEELKLFKFEKRFLNNKDDIYKFLKQVIDILEFLKLVYLPLETHEFLQAIYTETSGLPPKKKEEVNKVMALLRLTRNMISASDNSRYLIFSLIIKNGTDYTRVAHILANGLWHINKIVFFDEIWQNDKSNLIRPRYLKYISRDLNFNDIQAFFHLNESTEEDNYYKRNSILKINPINFIINSNSDSARYAIWFTTFLVNHSALNFANANAYVDTDVEHIRPEKWKTFNSEIKCKTDDLIQPLHELLNSGDYSESLKLMLKDLAKKFDALEDFDLKDESNAPKSSIIQFIGNKLVLDQGQNRGLQNKSYGEKFSAYRRIAQKFMIPTFNFSKIGIVNFEDEFRLKEILKRSLFFVDIVHKYYQSSLSEIRDLDDI